MVSQPVMLNGDSFSMCFWANLGEFGTRIQPLFVSPLLLLGRLSTRERVCASARACNTCVPCVRAVQASEFNLCLSSGSGVSERIGACRRVSGFFSSPNRELNP